MEQLEIIEKKLTCSTLNYILKLDRNTKRLLVFARAPVREIKDMFCLREDFNLDSYDCYELRNSFSCIFGGKDNPTPSGLFRIKRKCLDEYISKYYGNNRLVKFFGYLEIFEDYFIHSNLYDIGTSMEEFHNGKAFEKRVGENDRSTKGCIRVSQDDLQWLLSNIDDGTLIIL